MGLHRDPVPSSCFTINAYLVVSHNRDPIETPKYASPSNVDLKKNAFLGNPPHLSLYVNAVNKLSRKLLNGTLATPG